MTSTTFAVGLMLAATIGFSACPQTFGGFEELETSDEDSGDQDLDEDTSGYVDPDTDTGELSESDESGGDGDPPETGDPSETGETGDACGDFAVQVGEECDGWNTNFATCLDLGFIEGELACNDDCTFDVSDCVSPGCGNGIIETTEACDASPYPCWALGYAGSTDTDGMTPCQADCTPSGGGCDSTCEWGQPGCFCWATTPCPDGYLCSPHPQGWVDAPGTCKLAACNNAGSVCMTGMTASPACCPGLACVDSLCV